MSEQIQDEDNKLIKEIEEINNTNPPIKYTLKQKFFSELVGTLILLFVGTGVPVFTDDIVASSIGGGLILTPLIYIFGKISGAHFNPAVSIPMFLLKKISLTELIIYFFGQLFGAFLASFSVALCRKLKFDKLAANQVGTFLLELDNITTPDIKCYFSATFCEAIITFILVLVVYSSGVTVYNFANLTGIIVPITLSTLIFTGVKVSGGSLNPVRSFAPAFLQAVTGNDSEPLKQVWIYFVGPISGGIIGAFCGKMF